MRWLDGITNSMDMGLGGLQAGEGKGYPLQYSWASLVAQLVKNPPAMQETWVPLLGWEDPLEKGMATHSREEGMETVVCSLRVPEPQWT